jgi:hypothetical protein
MVARPALARRNGSGSSLVAIARCINLPAGDDFASGIGANYVYDHPFTTMPAADRGVGLFSS